MAADASGAAGRRIYLDAVDEAMQRRRALVVAPKAPRKPRRQLNDIAIRQLKHAEKLQRIMGRTIAEASGPERLDEHGKPIKQPEITAAFVQSFNQLTQSITNAMEQIRRGDKAEKEKLGGLSEEQMDEVFKQQLERIATKLDDYDRYVLLLAWYGEEVAMLITGKEA